MKSKRPTKTSLVSIASLVFLSFRLKNEVDTLEQTGSFEALSMGSQEIYYAIPYKGDEVWPEKQWQWEKPRTLAALANDELVITKQNDEYTVNYKQYLYDEDGVERQGTARHEQIPARQIKSGEGEVACADHERHEEIAERGRDRWD